MKPLIIGMNNPQGNPPLHPTFPNCAGWRLWKMLEIISQEHGVSCTQEEYLAAFDRLNMIEDKDWSAVAARRRAMVVRPKLEGRTTVLLGRAVPASLSLPQTPWMVWSGAPIACGGVWCVIPHPSGITREYNSLEMRHRVGRLLFELYSEQLTKAA